LKRDGRIFALTLMGGFLFVALVAYWRSAETVMVTAVGLAAVSFLAALLVPNRLEPARRAWMRLGEGIGRITTPIMLAIVYYAVVTPIGLIRRATVRRTRSGSGSAWHQRPPLPPPEKMERQF